MYEALQAGNLRGAADILWSALKVAFNRGVEALGAIWQRLTGLLQPAWAKLKAGATDVWERITTAAGTAAAWVANVWAQLPTWITGPLGQVGTALGSLGSYLGSVFGDLFGQLGGIFSTTFSGLWDAVSGGDWEAAGQIIMSGLEAAWLTGVAKLTEIWQGMKAAMIETFAGVVIAVHKMWSGMVEGLSKKLLDLAAQDGVAGAVARKLIGVDMRAENAKAKQLESQRREVVKRNLEGTVGQWQQELTVATESGDTAKVERLTAAIAQAQKELAGLSGPLGSATEDAKQIVADATRDAQDAVGAYWGGVAGNEAADAAVENARRAADDARKRLEQTAGLPDQPGAEGAGGKSALQKAREELDAALAAAKAKPGLMDAGKLQALQAKVDQAGNGLDDLPGAASGAKPGEVQGSFNAMAIRGMGVDSLAQRTAKATEAVAKNTDELVRRAEDGGLAFA